MELLIKGTAKEVPYYALDFTIGLSNAIDENLDFGVDAYEPYDRWFTL